MGNLAASLHNVFSQIYSRTRGQNLKALCARSSIALGLGAIAGQGARFIRNIILARILAREEFGLVAIAFAATMVLDALAEVGVKQSVIQNKRGADPDYLNVAWWFQAARGLGLFAIGSLAAPWISSFYEKPELLNLLRVSFVAILLRALASPRAYVLEKEFKFGWAAFLTHGSAVVGTIVAVSLAFVVRNVWALVIGYVAEAAIFCLVSYIYVPFRPRFGLDRQCLWEVVRFARGMFGLPILVAITFQIDIAVLGKTVTSEQLGLYYMAVGLAQMPITAYSTVIGPVLLPAFAQKQEDKKSLVSGVIRTTQWTALLTIPLVALLACCPSEILSIAYGNKFIAATIPFGILCLQVIARNESVILSTVYFALGQPDLNRRFAILRAAIIVGLIYPSIVLFGLAGAAGVVVLGNFVPLLFQAFWCRRIIDLKFGRYVRSYIPGLLSALPVILTAGLLKLLQIKSSAVILVVSGAVLAAIYAVYIRGILVSRFRTDSSPAGEQQQGTSANLPAIESENV